MQSTVNSAWLDWRTSDMSEDSVGEGSCRSAAPSHLPLGPREIRSISLWMKPVLCLSDQPHSSCSTRIPESHGNIGSRRVHRRLVDIAVARAYLRVSLQLCGIRLKWWRTSSFFMQRCRVPMVTAEPNRMSGSESKTLRMRLLSSASGGHARRICDIVRLLRRDGGAPAWLSGTSDSPTIGSTTLPDMVRASGARVIATMPPTLPPSSHANSAECKLPPLRPVLSRENAISQRRRLPQRRGLQVAASRPPAQACGLR
jgi:hypothetical protein